MAIHSAVCYRGQYEQFEHTNDRHLAILRRKRKPRPASPEIDRRAEKPFNGETASRLVSDPYSTTGGKILTTASLRDDPLAQLYA